MLIVNKLGEQGRNSEKEEIASSILAQDKDLAKMEFDNMCLIINALLIGIPYLISSMLIRKNII